MSAASLSSFPPFGRLQSPGSYSGGFICVNLSGLQKESLKKKKLNAETRTDINGQQELSR